MAMMNKQIRNILMLLFLAGFSACHQAANSTKQVSNAAAPASAGNSNRPDNAGAGQAAEPSKAGSEKKVPVNEAGLLDGTYVSSEVQHDGIIDMITPDNSTVISFEQPASFSRFSKSKGKVNHTDSGQFAIEGKELVLKIVMSQKQFQVKPVEKRFTYSISADGEELKLTSDKNKTAVFRKVKNAASAKG